MAENEYLSKEEAVTFLLRSAEDWNIYRQNHPDFRPDLCGSNFFGTNLRVTSVQIRAGVALMFLFDWCFARLHSQY